MTEKPFEFALTDAEVEGLTGERAVTYWIPIKVVGLYFALDNPKEHDVSGIIESIERHGYKDSPTFDKNLKNVGETGEGAFASGNGQTFALLSMYQSGDYDAPDGVKVDTAGTYGEPGEWFIPVEFGLDAQSEAQARAFVLDHNNLTLLGGNFGLSDVIKMYDAHKLARFTETMLEQGVEAVTLDEQDIEAIKKYTQEPEDYDDTETDFAEVDYDDPDAHDYKCPHCGYEWKGNPK